MKKSRRDFLDVYKKVRKPMPPPDKAMDSKFREEEDERWDWRKELEELGNDNDEEERE